MKKIKEAGYQQLDCRYTAILSSVRGMGDTAFLKTTNSHSYVLEHRLPKLTPPLRPPKKRVRAFSLACRHRRLIVKPGELQAELSGEYRYFFLHSTATFNQTHVLQLCYCLSWSSQRGRMNR